MIEKNINRLKILDNPIEVLRRLYKKEIITKDEFDDKEKKLSLIMEKEEEKELLWNDFVEEKDENKIRKLGPIKIMSNGKISLKDASEEIKEFICEVFENSTSTINNGNLEISIGKIKITFRLLKRYMYINIIFLSSNLSKADNVYQLVIRKVDEIENIQIEV